MDLLLKHSNQLSEDCQHRGVCQSSSGEPNSREFVITSVRVGEFQSGEIGETAHRGIQFEPMLDTKKAGID